MPDILSRLRNTIALLALLLAIPFTVRADSTSKPSMGEIVEAAMQGLAADATVKYVASSAGIDQEDLINTDLATDERTVRYVQNIVVENLHATISVCLCSTTWATTCASLACSCRGGGSPSMIVAPGKSRAFRFDGTRRVCAVTSASAGEWQAERSTVLVGAR